MSWNEINLKKIRLEDKPERPIAGRYDAMILPGATIDRDETLTVPFATIKGGIQRKLFYPDPNGKSKNGKSMTWSIQALNLLLDAVAPEKDERNIMQVLAGAVGQRFSIELKPYQNQYGKVALSADIWSVRAVQQ